MKITAVHKLFGNLLNGLVKKGIPDRRTRRNIRDAYLAVVGRASDIGSDNTLLSSYLLAAYFIAMNRTDSLSPEENIRILENGLKNSRAVRAFLGNNKTYFSEKHMEARRAWSKKTYERKYKNDWVVDVLEKTDDYDFGFNYRECGVCKLCRDEGCPELAHFLCSLDFMLVELIDVRLDRTMTLADGAPYCDFRFHQS